MVPYDLFFGIPVISNNIVYQAPSVSKSRKGLIGKTSGNTSHLLYATSTFAIDRIHFAILLVS
ncbi:hypothetical protein ABZX51_006727 [Aspergillus tubingensis]